MAIRRVRLSMLVIALSVCAACSHDDDDDESPNESATPGQAAASHAPAGGPRKIDRGDGCLVDVLAEGTGRELAAGDEVVFAYEARVCGADAPFASTRESLEPCIARLDPSAEPRLIPGLVRGLTGLTVGTKARIEVPPELAYGKEGLAAAGIPADAPLVFDVEVLGVR